MIFMLNKRKKFKFFHIKTHILAYLSRIRKKLLHQIKTSLNIEKKSIEPKN